MTNNIIKEIFAPLPLYKEIPRTIYKDRCIFSDKNCVKKLILEVVETPAFQLVNNTLKHRQSTKNYLLDSRQFIPESGLNGIKRTRLTLDYFRSEPFSPFIPDLILIGVNLIEQNAYETKQWEIYFKINMDRKFFITNYLLLNYLNNPLTSQQIIKNLSEASILDIALAIMKFFTFFDKKLMHFDSYNQQKLVSNSLFDRFLRPNPAILEVVKSCALKSSRTEIDTLAFMMIHILHLWEYSKTPLKTKFKISKIFGPLLISFEEPMYINRSENKPSPQASVLEAIMEICDGEFWINLTSSKRTDFFQCTSEMEKHRSNYQLESRKKPEEFMHMCNPYSLFPTIEQRKKIHSIRYTRNKSFRHFNP